MYFTRQQCQKFITCSIEILIRMKKLIQTLIVMIVLVTLSVGTGFVFSELQQSDNPDERVVENQITTRGTSDQIDSGDVEIENILESTATIYVSRDGAQRSLGSSFQFSDQYVVTNQHVVEGQSEVILKYSDGDWSEADVVGTDVHSDVAVLEPDDVPEDADPFPIAEDLPSVGESIIAVGSPRGRHDSVSTGVISGLRRAVQIQTEYIVPDSIQTDAALNPGNSGGPLIDSDTGAVLGINRATNGENVGYATSSRIVSKVASSIIENGDYDHSYIGIETVGLNPLTEDDYNVSSDVDSGLIVVDTIEDTPGEDAFLTSENGEADIIKRIDNKEIKNNEDLSSYIMRKTDPGDTIEVTVVRDNVKKIIEVELESRP